MSEHVKYGVFFESPGKLPRGRHDLSRDQVRAAQRERLMIAVTELLAERGYLAVGIREIATRAGVSRAAFYECFADKQECVFAAHDRFVSVLQERFAAAVTPTGDTESLITSMVAAYLGVLQEDLVAARAIQVETDALGREARKRRRRSLRRLAAFIHDAHQEALGDDPGVTVPDESWYLAVVQATRQAACDLLDEQPEPDLVGLVPEIAAWAVRTLEPSPRSGAAVLGGAADAHA